MKERKERLCLKSIRLKQFMFYLLCAKNAEFEKIIQGGGSAVAVACAWHVWEGYQGDTSQT